MTRFRSKTEIEIRNQTLIFLREQPLHSIKVTQITTALNIHRTTFYKYYTSVYDVVEQIENDILDNVQPALRLGKDVHIKTLGTLISNREAISILLGKYGEEYYQVKSLKVLRERFKFLTGSLKIDSSKQYELMLLVGSFVNHGKLHLMKTLSDQGYHFSNKKLSELITKLEDACIKVLEEELKNIHES
ncbi:MAG: TetR/AcrR family transcriptional regulator [Lachnospiraceae bacterium]|nr:TetR/AcrR family transcriptional regulator [Lachnospiraceae bacterium]